MELLREPLWVAKDLLIGAGPQYLIWAHVYHETGFFTAFLLSLLWLGISSRNIIDNWKERHGL
jgi:hypothetical protein